MTSQTENLYFRNYKPRDPKLQRLMMSKPEIPKVEIEIDTEIIKTVNGQVDLSVIAPKRDTMDFKWDLEDKMAILQRRTERALERFTISGTQEGTS